MEIKTPYVEIITEGNSSFVYANGKLVSGYGRKNAEESRALAEAYVKGYKAAIKHSRFNFIWKIPKPFSRVRGILQLVKGGK